MPGFECIVCSMSINKLTSLEAMTECATLSNTDVDTRATSLQSGASSHAKHGGAYFSAVRWSIKDPIAVPGRDEVQEC